MNPCAILKTWTKHCLCLSGLHDARPLTQDIRSSSEESPVPPLNIVTSSSLQPFSVEDAVRACEGTPGQGILDDKPLRLLVPSVDDGAYELMPYTGQSYIAISYCWPGGDSFTKLSTSNDSSVVHTPQGPLQSSHFSKYIACTIDAFNATLQTHHAVWIDYHCINQSDNEEKTIQVAILQRIYTGAITTAVMLEDIALTPQELTTLLRIRTNPAAVALVKRVLAARWFSRAWCSQELVLSRKAIFFVHDASNPGDALKFDSDTFWHAMEIARTHDTSIPLFSVPRGSVKDEFVLKNTAWALNIVQSLGCSDEYDKIALVCNLLRYIYRFKDRPTAFGAPPSSVATVRLNVLKMANVLAIVRRDCSLLLANHGTDNPFLGETGFGWAGVPVYGDKISELWDQKHYEHYRDPDITVDRGALVVRGVLAEVMREHVWQVRHDTTGLKVSVNGTIFSVPINVPANESWTWSRDRLFFHHLLLALVHSDSQCAADVSLHARIVLAYLLAEPDYQLQPDPIPGDLATIVRIILAEGIGRLKDIASALQFLRRGEGRMSFSTVLLNEGSVLLVSGSAPQGELCGRLVFQPFVVRPKLFSPPMAMTANSMILDKDPLPDGTRRCVGCVRGLGMVSEMSSAAIVEQLKVV